MVSLIQHAAVDRAPAEAAWRLAGSVALGLVALAGIIRTLADYDPLIAVYRPTSLALLGAAGVALLIGASRPTPLMLVALLGAIYSLVWILAVSYWLKTEEPATQRD